MYYGGKMHMDKIPDYSKLTFEQLIDVCEHIDKDKYPERYNIILKEIDSRKASQIFKTVSPTEVTITRIRIVYIVLIIMSVLIIPSSFLMFGRIDISFFALAGIMIIAYSLVYYGLLKKKAWTVNLVLFVSAFGILQGLTNTFVPVEKISDVVIKAINIVLMMFYIYQVLFFRKQEVAQLFKTGNVDVF